MSAADSMADDLESGSVRTDRSTSDLVDGFNNLNSSIDLIIHF